MIKKVAIIMLACKDYESMEIALAAYAKNMKENYKLYILQNGRHTYDCERVLRLANRYKNLYPCNIDVITSISPQKPYKAIQELINSEVLKDYDYICKVDDDVFPLHENWLEKLIECYKLSKIKYGDKLAYVTSLINNNTWGFRECLKIFNLEEEYFKNYSRDHIIGNNNDINEEPRLISKDEIYTGCAGTVWRNPYIARWLHEKTTLLPEKYLKLTENLGYKEVHNDKRYSINCMFFEKNFWNIIEMKDHYSDEYMAIRYCVENNMKIVADLSNPFVHILYAIQREENRDLIPIIRETYEKFLNLPFPIAISPNKNYELENRLRETENRLIKFETKIKNLEQKLIRSEKKLLNSLYNEQTFFDTLSSNLNSNKKVLLWGASNFLKTLLLKYPLKDSNIIGIIDIDAKKWGKKFNDYKIFEPKSIKKLNPDTIIVSIINNKEKRIAEIKEYLKIINKEDIIVE